MAKVEVIKAGLLTTIQDMGRFGFGYFGVPQSGPIDQCSFRLLHRILQNSNHTAVLECNFIGCSLFFHGETKICITGADMKWCINDIPISRNRAYKINIGDTLSSTKSINGNRAYIGFGGDIDVPTFLGSKSTFTYGTFGGLHGRQLRVGDQLSILNHDRNPKLLTAVSSEYNAITHIKFVEGPEWSFLSSFEQSELRNKCFSIHPNSNRMGLHLKGKKIEIQKYLEASVPVFPGIIQLPPSGEPIVLMVDCQTTGGYPRIGFINPEELCKLAQIPTGKTFRLIAS